MQGSFRLALPGSQTSFARAQGFGLIESEPHRKGNEEQHRDPD